METLPDIVFSKIEFHSVKPLFRVDVHDLSGEWLILLLSMLDLEGQKHGGFYDGITELQSHSSFKAPFVQTVPEYHPAAFRILHALPFRRPGWHVVSAGVCRPDFA